MMRENQMPSINFIEYNYKNTEFERLKKFVKKIQPI